MELLFPSDPARRLGRDRWLAVILAVLAVALVVRAAIKEDGVLVHNQQFGARFLEHKDPYFDAERNERIHGPYPPSYAWITAPLSLLPTTAARIAWASLQIGALIVAYRVLRARARILWPRLAPHALVIFAGALMLVSRFLLRDMAAGGGNLLYATIALCALELAWRGRELVAGAVFAMSLVLKPNLAPLALFFAARARWRVVAATIVCGAALYLAPGLWFGLTSYVELSKSWANSVIEYSALDDLHADERVPAGMPRDDSSMNQSLRAALDRVLRPSDDRRIDDVHVATLEPATIAWISRGVVVVFIAAACLASARARDLRGELLAAVAFLPLAHLASPITWKAHHAALLPLFFALLCVAAEVPRRKWLAALLVVYYLACDLASEEVLGKRNKNLLQALSIVTWFDVVLFVVALALASASSAASAPPAGSRVPVSRPSAP